MWIRIALQRALLRSTATGALVALLFLFLVPGLLMAGHALVSLAIALLLVIALSAGGALLASLTRNPLVAGLATLALSVGLLIGFQLQHSYLATLTESFDRAMALYVVQATLSELSHGGWGTVLKLHLPLALPFALLAAAQAASLPEAGEAGLVILGTCLLAGLLMFLPPHELLLSNSVHSGELGCFVAMGMGAVLGFMSLGVQELELILERVLPEARVRAEQALAS